MSMDNGIYVLECRGQYRVKELSTSTIANLGWSFLSFSDTETVVPTRVIEAFRDAKPICSRRFAEHIAFQMLYKEDYVEYGINVIKVDKTWEQIEEEAVP